MTRTNLCTRLWLPPVLALVLLPVSAVAQSPIAMSVWLGAWPGESTSTTPYPVLYTHTRGDAQFGKSRMLVGLAGSNPAFPPPYTLRAELSPGITRIVPFSPPSGLSCQPAQGGGSSPIVIECTITTPITQIASGLHFEIDTGGPAQFGGASAYARVTLDHAGQPLPPEPTCTTNTGTTGCVLRQSQVFTSELQLTGMNVQGGSMVIGQVTPIRIDASVLGFDSAYDTAIAIELPVGLVYVSVESLIGVAPTCTAAPSAEGQRVTCISSLYSADPWGTPRTTWFNLNVRPSAPLAPPGPVRVVGSIGHEAQPAPSNCAAQPGQAACADVGFALAPPPVVDLRFTGASAPQPWLALGRPQPLQVTFRNVGGAAAGQTRVLAQLPAGFSYLSASSPSPAACTASGTVANGQQVVCTQGGLIAAWGDRVLTIEVLGDPWLAEPIGNVAVFAVTDGTVLDGPTLLACASDPEPAHCAWLEFPVRAPCPGGPEDSVYCDGFEPLPEVEADGAAALSHVRRRGESRLGARAAETFAGSPNGFYRRRSWLG